MDEQAFQSGTVVWKKFQQESEKRAYSDNKSRPLKYKPGYKVLKRIFFTSPKGE